MVMRACASTRLASLEAELEATEAWLAWQLGPEAASINATWRSFRDADCELVASGYEGGTIQPVVHGTCLGNHTDDRIESLLDHCERTCQRLRSFDPAKEESTNGDPISAVGTITSAAPNGSVADRVVSVDQLASEIVVSLPADWGPLKGTARHEWQVTLDDGTTTEVMSTEEWTGLVNFGGDEVPLFLVGRFTGQLSVDGEEETTAGFWYATLEPGANTLVGTLVSEADPENGRSEFRLTIQR